MTPKTHEQPAVIHGGGAFALVPSHTPGRRERFDLQRLLMNESMKADRIASRGRDRIVQHVSIFKSGPALERPRRRDAETNRARTIQVEIVVHAAQTDQVGRDELRFLSWLARWTERDAGVPSRCEIVFVPFPPRWLQGQR
jgi:hypothetical protein